MKSPRLFYGIGIVVGILVGLAIGSFLTGNFFELLDRLLNHF